MSLNNPQPSPVESNATPSWELVVKDMQDRDNVGRQKYGVPLKARNGRDSLVDAYQEVLDLAVYLRTEIEDRKIVTDSLKILGGSTSGSAAKRPVQLATPRYRTAEGWVVFRTTDSVTIEAQDSKTDGKFFYRPADRYRTWADCERDPDTFECDEDGNRIGSDEPIIVFQTARPAETKYNHELDTLGYFAAITGVPPELIAATYSNMTKEQLLAVVRDQQTVIYELKRSDATDATSLATVQSILASVKADCESVFAEHWLKEPNIKQAVDYVAALIEARYRVIDRYESAEKQVAEARNSQKKVVAENRELRSVIDSYESLVRVCNPIDVSISTGPMIKPSDRAKFVIGTVCGVVKKLNEARTEVEGYKKQVETREDVVAIYEKIGSILGLSFKIDRDKVQSIKHGQAEATVEAVRRLVASVTSGKTYSSGVVFTD